MSVSAASARSGSFRWLAFVLRNALLPLLLGAVAVVSILPFNFAAFALWFALLASRIRKDVRQQQPNLAVISAIIQVAIMVAVVTAAHLAPGKTTDRFLDRTITLPKSRMTLAELAGDPDEPPPEWRPYSVRISAQNDEKSQVIVFPDTNLTLRQFVGAIESQSTLRHRFGHCGNGWTIIGGGDCSFGLHLRAPNGHTK